MEYEKPVSLSKLFDNKSMSDEYYQLEDITGYRNNYDGRSEVQNSRIIDASFIKTPLNEVKGNQAFGLMIATDGYAMKKGLQEFWNIVV